MLSRILAFFFFFSKCSAVLHIDALSLKPKPISATGGMREKYDIHEARSRRLQTRLCSGPFFSLRLSRAFFAHPFREGNGVFCSFAEVEQEASTAYAAADRIAAYAT